MSDCSRRAWEAGGVRVLRRWDRVAREYVPYRVPASWKVSCYETDMDVRVNCAGCGREMPWGETYTSLEIHTEGGSGYGVCEACYLEEAARERKAGRR